MGKVGSHTVSRRVGTKQSTDTFRFVSQLPLRNSDDALLVNWFEIVTTNDNDDITYQNAWSTSHPITGNNVAQVVEAGRSRWKIENENTLKTKGYHFEHNFGHGQQNLYNLFATMILLAFLLHTALDLLDLRYRAALPSCSTFLEHIRALLRYLPFDN